MHNVNSVNGRSNESDVTSIITSHVSNDIAPIIADHVNNCEKCFFPNTTQRKTEKKSTHQIHTHFHNLLKW